MQEEKEEAQTWEFFGALCKTSNQQKTEALKTDQT